MKILNGSGKGIFRSLFKRFDRLFPWVRGRFGVLDGRIILIRILAVVFGQSNTAESVFGIGLSNNTSIESVRDKFVCLL